MKEESFAWFAGVDWGSEHHQVCLVDAQGRIVGEREFPHGGKGLADLCDWLLSICGAANSVAVGIEVPHGPVVDTLIDRGFVLHAINPKQLDRLRDRHSVAGAKDDRRDAYVLGDGVRTDRRLFLRQTKQRRVLARPRSGSGDAVRGIIDTAHCGRTAGTRTACRIAARQRIPEARAAGAVSRACCAMRVGITMGGWPLAYTAA